ncbi:MAG: hypothetical protein COV47_00975 [Candidatus Diapherotrites archaeon CG11_big_fil_rev_8_21_14_0_20_37_9]|nr:MAG: hypothetical protein COV47_00975 [Candidatus Diapherotrites archaeon CG11_big_fil_rev_8_21_14_0_20_37_9]
MRKKTDFGEMFFNSIQKKLFIAFLLISLGPILITTYFSFVSVNDYIFDNALSQNLSVVENTKNELQLYIKIQIDDAIILSNLHTTKSVLRAKDNKDIDPITGKTLEQAINELETQFLVMAQNKKDYLQIRLLDEKGYELVRVNSKQGDAYAVPAEGLQYKGNRNYFIDTMALPKTANYISNLNLNVENSRIEIPYVPTMRFISKVNNEEGKTVGLIVINIDAKQLLEKTKKYGEQIFLANNSGGYLNHQDIIKNFGFDLGKDYNMFEDMPELTALFSQNIVSVVTDEVVINAERIYYSSDDPSKAFIIVSAQNKKDILSPLTNFQLTYFAIIIILFIFIFGSSFYLSESISKPVKNLYEGIKEIEKGNFYFKVKKPGTNDEFDELTETFNKTNEMLLKSEKQREEIDKAKTEFISITSHELRSPMTPMKAQLQMLEHGYFGKLNAKQSKSVELILKNAEHLDHIIQDFLEISRIEAARLKFHFVNTNLNKIIEETIDTMSGFMKEKKIKIINKSEKLPNIMCDPNRVSQVFRNLLNNAIKFSPEKSTITVGAQIKEEYIEFYVKDEGIGIEPENRIRIFEPFFQAEQTIYREHQGTGLGLAICKGIVESQNGSLWVESKHGKGAVFFFTLPLKPISEIKPIKILFSNKSNIDEKIKQIFLSYLGPIGESEYIRLKEKGLRQAQIKDYIKELMENSIIPKTTADEMLAKLESAYSLKKSENEKKIAIKEEYVKLLGPMGENRFKFLNNPTDRVEVLSDIKILENQGIITKREQVEFKSKIEKILN